MRLTPTVISRKHRIGYDEIHAEWFSCPSCVSAISYGAKYCPECGTRILWATNAHVSKDDEWNEKD